MLNISLAGIPHRGVFHSLFLIGAILFGAFSPTESKAYTSLVTCGGLNARWNVPLFAAKAQTRSFPKGSDARAGLNEVVRELGANPSNLRYSIAYTNASPAFRNNVNDVLYYAGLVEAPAATYVLYNILSCEIVEADVLFGFVEPFTTSHLKADLYEYGGMLRPFQTTAEHELIHAGGLGNTATTYSIMGQDWSHLSVNGPFARAFSGEDVAAGMIGLYGRKSSGSEDLAVVHWRRTGSRRGYSIHGRTGVFDCADARLPEVAGKAEPTFQVVPGQCVKVQFTYETASWSDLITSNVIYYLSMDDTITVDDRPLKRIKMTFSRDVPQTRKVTLYLPSDLTPDQDYWLGVIVNPNGRIKERNKWNNASYIGIHTSP